MSKFDFQYHNILSDILNNGSFKDNRTGVGSISLFGKTMEIDLKEGFPLLTTKKMFYKGIIHELLWFLRGETNIKYLVDNNVHIWDDDAYRFYCEKIEKEKRLVEYFNENDSEFYKMRYNENVSKEEFIEKVKNRCELTFIDDITYKDNIFGESTLAYIDSLLKGLGNYNFKFSKYVFGDLGPVYGKQWRSFGESGFDQISDIITKLKTDPDNRRILLTGYNPDVLDEIALPPCHILAQFYTTRINGGDDRELSCLFYCRSQDFPLGTPFNIASYALLTHIIANICDMSVGKLIYVGGDCHIYLNQLNGVSEQLLRDPYKFPMPKLKIRRKIYDVSELTYDDFEIDGYESYDKIDIPLSVGLASINSRKH